MDQRDFNPLYYAAQPVRMARRAGGRGLMGDIAELAWPVIFYGAPIWIPAAIVYEMYVAWHPVAATVVAVPFIAALLAFYAFLIDKFEKRKTRQSLVEDYEYAYEDEPAPSEYIARVSPISLGGETEVAETEVIHTGEFALGREAQEDLDDYKKQIEDRIERDAPTVNEYVSEERVLELKQTALKLYSEADPVSAIKDYVQSELEKSDKWWTRDQIKFVSWVVLDLACYDERKASWAENYTEKERLANLQDAMDDAFDEALNA